MHTVTTYEAALAVREYFNAFHDGFIKTLTLVSHDVFEARGVQAASARLDLTLCFAHYNYQQGSRPASQLITGQFYEVMDLSLACRGFLHEWSIYDLSFSEAHRMLEDGREEPCLRAVLQQSRLSPSRTWQQHEDLAFTFRRATFEEHA